MFKLFKKAHKISTKDVTVKPEPKFLNEYIAEVGRTSTVYVYARSASEAREKVLSNMRSDVPYYDSERLRTCTHMEDARTKLCGGVKVFYNGVSTRRNPAYSG